MHDPVIWDKDWDNEAVASVRDALDHCYQDQLYGAASYIAIKDMGAPSKLVSRYSTKAGLIDTNQAESVMIQASGAGKVQPHKSALVLSDARADALLQAVQSQDVDEKEFPDRTTFVSIKPVSSVTQQSSTAMTKFGMFSPSSRARSCDSTTSTLAYDSDEASIFSMKG